MIDQNAVFLFYLSSFAGLIMVVGSIWLIFKEKIYIDRATGQPVEIETPLGKFKTNVPALALFVIGFFFLAFPIIKVSELMRDTSRTVGINGSVESTEEPIVVYAVVAEQTMWKDKHFRLTVPVPRSGFPNYSVLAQTGLTVDVQRVEVGDGAKLVDTKPFQFQAPPPSSQGETGADFQPDTVAVPSDFAEAR